MDKLILLTQPPEDLTAPTVDEISDGIDLTPLTEAAASYAEALGHVGADLAEKLAGLDYEAVQRALLQAQAVERGTRVNPNKDRRLHGKARRRARRSR